MRNQRKFVVHSAGIIRTDITSNPIAFFHETKELVYNSLSSWKQATIKMHSDISSTAIQEFFVLLAACSLNGLLINANSGIIPLHQISFGGNDISDTSCVEDLCLSNTSYNNSQLELDNDILSDNLYFDINHTLKEPSFHRKKLRQMRNKLLGKLVAEYIAANE